MHGVVARLAGGLWSGPSHPLVIRRGVINIATAADHTLAAAITGKRLFLVSCFVMAGGTVNMTFKTAAGGTALGGAIPLIANTGFVLPNNDNGWIETVAGQALTATLDAAVQVSGFFTYVALD